MRNFEVKAIKTDKHGNPTMLVCMDLETYSEALENFIDHLKDEYFNVGFEAGQNPYPTEEELANMDDDNSKEN